MPAKEVEKLNKEMLRRKMKRRQEQSEWGNKPPVVEEVEERPEAVEFDANSGDLHCNGPVLKDFKFVIPPKESEASNPTMYSFESPEDFRRHIEGRFFSEDEGLPSACDTVYQRTPEGETVTVEVEPATKKLSYPSKEEVEKGSIEKGAMFMGTNGKFRIYDGNKWVDIGAKEDKSSKEVVAPYVPNGVEPISIEPGEFDVEDEGEDFLDWFNFAVPSPDEDGHVEIPLSKDLTYRLKEILFQASKDAKEERRSLKKRSQEKKERSDW